MTRLPDTASFADHLEEARLNRVVGYLLNLKIEPDGKTLTGGIVSNCVCADPNCPCRTRLARAFGIRGVVAEHRKDKPLAFPTERHPRGPISIFDEPGAFWRDR